MTIVGIIKDFLVAEKPLFRAAEDFQAAKTKIFTDLAKATKLAKELEQALDAIFGAPEIVEFRKQIKKWQTAIDNLPDKITYKQQQLGNGEVWAQHIDNVKYGLEMEKSTLKTATKKLALVSAGTLEGLACKCCHCMDARSSSRVTRH